MLLNRRPTLRQMREHTLRQTVHMRVASITQKSQFSEYTKRHTCVL